MNNIERFNYFVGLIFGRLQREFPRKVQAFSPEILGATECDETTSGAGRWTGIHLRDGEKVDLKEELEFLWSTLTWLKETGYLIGTVDATHGGRVATVTLSPKALEVLKAVPSTLDGKETLGEQLEGALKSAAKDKIAELAGSGLTWLFKYGWLAIA